LRHYAALAVLLLAGLILVEIAVIAYRLRPNRTVVRETPSGGVDFGLRVDPNRASAEALAEVPGFSRRQVEALVAYREACQTTRPAGAVFLRLEDLALVPGIGPKTLDRVKSHLRFEPETDP